MNSHASGWLNAAFPRRATPARPSAGNSRPRRNHSAVTARVPVSARNASSMGMNLPLPAGADTLTSHTPPESGEANSTSKVGRWPAVTVLDH